MGKKKKRKEKIIYIDRNLNSEPKTERPAPPIKNFGGIAKAAEKVTPLEAIQGLFEQIGKLRQENPLPEPTPEQRAEAAKRLRAFTKAMQMPGETILQHLKRIECDYTIEDYESFIASHSGGDLSNFIVIPMSKLEEAEANIQTPEEAAFDGDVPPNTHDPISGMQLTPVIDLGKETP